MPEFLFRFTFMPLVPQIWLHDEFDPFWELRIWNCILVRWGGVIILFYIFSEGGLWSCCSFLHHPPASYLCTTFLYALLFFFFYSFLFFTFIFWSVFVFYFPSFNFYVGPWFFFSKALFWCPFFLGHACFYTWSLGHQKCHCKARYELMITKHSAYWQLASAKSSKIATSSLPNLARQKPLLCLAIITSSSQHTMDGVVKVKNPISWRWH